MNRAVATCIIGEEAQAYSMLSLPRIENYANKINAELIVLKWPYPNHLFAPMAKFYLQKHLPRFSEGIFYVDIDTLISSQAPDIFEITPKTGISAVWDSKTEEPNQDWNKFIKAAAALTEIEPWVGYFNNGVFLARPDSIKMFNEPDLAKMMPWYPDQTIFNLNRARFHIPLNILDKKWNLMGQNGGNEETWKNCYVAHFAGYDMQTRGYLMNNMNLIIP